MIYDFRFQMPSNTPPTPTRPPTPFLCVSSRLGGGASGGEDGAGGGEVLVPLGGDLTLGD